MEAVEVTDSVESAANVADAVDAAMDVADTVHAAMEGVSTAVTAAMSASMTAAVTPVRRRDGRRESCRDDCGCESNRERRFSKHVFFSSAGRPPSAMLPPSADATLNVASRMREPVAISALQAVCRQRCQVGVSKIVKSN
jgi:hypothetical protein